MATKKTRAKHSAKSSGKREMKAALDKLQIQFKDMKAKLDDITLEEGQEPDELAVQTAKDFAEQMQDVNRGLREAIKNAMMADGKLKPGQVITFRGRRVFLKARAGCPEGSLDPEHYDLTYEMIQ
ncbi:MAG: hypothetical protein ACRD5G_06525 [Candidatus Acidiferrales bacterium]